MTAEFALALSVFVGGSFADTRTTDIGLNRGGYEMNPLMGKHPSDLRLYGQGAVWTVGVGLYAAHLYKRHPKAAVWLLIGAGMVHGLAAQHNAAPGD